MSIRKEKIAARYQDRAIVDSYDRLRYYGFGGRYKNRRLRRVIGEIVQSVPLQGPVLDLPCGTGRIDNWLLQLPVRVIAADISNEMLTKTREKTRPTPMWLGLVRADACHLPFPSRSIECVFSIRFFHLLDEPTRLAILQEFARVARQWVVVEYRRIETPVKAFKRAVNRRLFGRIDNPRWTLELIEREMDKCGLVVERYHYMSRWFSSLVVVQARHRVRT